ncbi:MAG: SGNH/GDSL hydrolase family protein [bacterium]
MFRKLIYTALIFVAALAVLEVTARRLEAPSGEGASTGNAPGWQTKFFRDLFEWHRPDPDLLWRFRPNLKSDYVVTNSRGFIGPELIDAPGDSVFRILLLGDSSPVGLGLPSHELSFGPVLAELLRKDAHCGQAVELINASVTGYSSEQVARLCELKAAALDPDLVIVYVGNNDASISGATSDSALMASQRLTGVRRWLGGFAIYRVMRALLTAGESDATGRTTEAQSQFCERVSPKRFRQNLKRIAGQCRDLGCPLVVVKPAVPLMWPAGLQFKVFQSTSGIDGELILPSLLREILGREVEYCFDWEDIYRRYGDGDRFTRTVYGSAFTDTLPAAAAMTRYLQLVQKQPQQPVWANNLAVSYWRTGDLQSAEDWSARAISLVEATGQAADSLLSDAARAVFHYNRGIVWLTESGRDLQASFPDTTRALAYLDSALQADFLSLRIKRAYLLVAQEMADYDVAAVDGPAALGQSSESPLAAEHLFIDHCHPTAAGHRLIAEAVYRALDSAGWLP